MQIPRGFEGDQLFTVIELDTAHGRMRTALTGTMGTCENPENAAKKIATLSLVKSARVVATVEGISHEAAFVMEKQVLSLSHSIGVTRDILLQLLIAERQ